MPENPFDLSGKVAIITGGGTGVGRATALVLSKHGATVVLASRKMQNLEAVAQEVKAQGGRALPVRTDVKVAADVEGLVKTTMEEFGQIDILVNNAGGTYMKPAEELTVENWDNLAALNVRGPFLGCLYAGRVMIQQKRGVIVNISSLAGSNGAWGVVPYASAKAGLQQMTKVLAGEWGKHGIRVNCVALGAVMNEGYVRSMTLAGKDPYAAKNALGRIGEPVDIAYPVLFLVSDASRWMTGETIAVCGGPRFQ